MDVLTRCLKFFIIVLNSVLLLGSLVLIAFGIIFHVGTRLSFFETLEADTKDNIRELMTATGIGDTDTIDKFTFTDLLKGWIVHVMIGTGIGFFILSFSGCCGTWYKMRMLLLIYIILMVLIIFLEALLLTLSFTVPVTIQGQIKRLLGFTLIDFLGLVGNNDETIGWMFAMKHFECCGIESYTDFQDHSVNWDRTPGQISTPIDAPLICCKTPPTGGNDVDVACARTGNLIDIYTEGCFDVIWNKVLAKSMYTYVTIANVVMLQFLLLVSSIMFYRDAKKKKNQVRPLKPSTNKMKKKKF